jgi:hypothetical protein
MSLTSHLDILVGYDNGESASTHCKIQTPQLKNPKPKNYQLCQNTLKTPN